MKNESFSSRLERLRKEKGLTRRRMADLVGLKESTYKDFELGSTPRQFPELVVKIASILDVSPGFLISGKSLGNSAALATAEKIKQLSFQLISDLR
jgi:transcriptional regulator with XRE-family HTH domain